MWRDGEMCLLGETWRLSLPAGYKVVKCSCCKPELSKHEINRQNAQNTNNHVKFTIVQLVYSKV